MNVLIIEPDADLRHWVEGELRKDGHQVKGAGKIPSLKLMGMADLIILGNRNPRRLQAWCKAIPKRGANPAAYVLGLCASGGVAEMRRMLAAGADDVAERDAGWEWLKLRLACAVRQAGRSSLHDPLTKVANRVLFLEMLKRTIGAARRRGAPGFGVLFLDLDGFKAINDRYGHPLGDRVLMTVAERLKKSLRSGDVVARYGGDEFAILLTQLKHTENAEEISRRLREVVAKPVRLGRRRVNITASIGVATSRPGYTRVESYLEAADRDMYRGKKATNRKEN